MGVRPNIQAPIKLEGAQLIVRGESVEPLPAAIHVVVVQRGATPGSAAVAIAQGVADRASTGWRASLPATDFKSGQDAETLGIEIRVAPFEVTSWVQTVPIT
jgi:hypothetical protein